MLAALLACHPNEPGGAGPSRQAAQALPRRLHQPTVMAMLIAWQTVNAVRRPTSRNFTRGFLVVTPGLTIRDRLRVLKPNDPDSYYESRELVPRDMLQDLEQARIVITNYHAFKLRETLELSKGGRALLQGRGPEIESIETEGQMLQRVMPELMGMRSIMAFNDEAHHCYREKPGEDDEGKLTGDDRREAEKNREAARLWISGLEAVNRKLGLRRVVDLSATPFFLRGSGYAEGTLFPWTMCDFSLMDAIECGIVKLPRVPVADNIPGTDVPLFRNLWDHIRSKMPRKGRGQAGELDPLSIPVELQTAIEALYGHYAETVELWENAGVEVPPCFIVVCNNTATSKLVYDYISYISGFQRDNPDGSTSVVNGRLELFQNYDEHANLRARPRTLLIDSQQLESGEGLDRNFRQAAAAEIEHFRRAEVQRTDRAAAEKIAVRGSRYSVPASCAGRAVEVRLGGATVTVTSGGAVVARHERSARKGAEVLVLDHYLEVLARKPGALPGSSALAQARSGGGFTAAHERFWQRARRRLGDAAGTRALIEVLLLHRRLPFTAVHAALDAVSRVGSVDPSLVAIEARRIADGRRETAVVERPALRRFDRPAPSLARYDGLLAGSVR